MDPFSFAPLAALLEAVYRLIADLAALLQPIAGASSAALAILVITVLVRALLIPVGVSQVKAEGTRRRLYPQLLALQRRHKKDPLTLQQKTAELYRAENSSPFAGILPALAQAPVLSVLYTLFARTTIDGHANALLGQQVFSAPLGGSFLQLVADGGGGVLAYLVLFAALAVVAGISRQIALRMRLVDPAAPRSAATLARVLSWLPFGTILVSAVVPFAAAVYLAASATWTLGERALLRRWYWRGPERAAPELPTPAH
jgi:YidC/Oxa1 family membrane protein insertase